MNDGSSTNAPNIAKPVKIAVRFVNRTVRCIIIRMSTIGDSTRSSVRTQSTASTALTTKSPSTRLEPHPHDGPSVIAEQQRDERRREQQRTDVRRSSTAS